MVNKPLIRPYFWGGYVRGGWLTSHYKMEVYLEDHPMACKWLIIMVSLVVNGVVDP